ncbi:THAP domain-containing protein 1-like [Spea bombifrons]|uniref:THAP domain-containing protein 1-like n=1 Tax=Spea bombifrons TaxID=233779 RepID=UPI00234B56CF|nr:THAP domain-containing protein 1-like [Spea bombifrons]XP_053330808.1 THAP domain-containing protein 1-like [Spea bombifrons]XP_053330809.1 THAP domain-containing protein 1-like [Spea bombifrons]XP_053330810.1 THAP domain-containing protein 1-like [Spea bombifrons]
MTVCAAYGCKNRLSKGCGKHFFRFPIKNPEKLSKWIAAVRRQSWSPTIYSRLCSDHFTEADYMLRPGASSPYLRTDAVPSIFPGFPPSLKTSTKKKRNEKILAAEPFIIVPEPPAPVREPKPAEPTLASTDHTYSAVSNDKENAVPAPAVSPATIKMRKKIKRLQKQVLRQRNKIKTMKLLLSQLRKDLADSEHPIYYFIPSADFQ